MNSPVNIYIYVAKKLYTNTLVNIYIHMPQQCCIAPEPA